MNDKNEESGIYYYHADHLGGSSVVTDKNGKFHEHLEYAEHDVRMQMLDRKSKSASDFPYGGRCLT